MFVCEDTRQDLGVCSNFESRIRYRYGLLRADDFADSTVNRRADIAAEQVAEGLEPRFGNRSVEAIRIAAGNGVDDAAQHRFIRRKLGDSPRELRQFRHGDLGIGRPAHLHATQNAQLDPDPLADQFTLRDHLETLQNPSKCIRVIGLECCDRGSEGAGILSKATDGVGLRDELTHSALLQSHVAHDGFLL